MVGQQACAIRNNPKLSGARSIESIATDVEDPVEACAKILKRNLPAELEQLFLGKFFPEPGIKFVGNI